MSAPVNHWKLGLFVVSASLLALVAIVFLGSLGLSNKSINYTSYFDEAVTGLEKGSAVKFRGVTIGNVSGIDVAPDRRLVEVSYDLRVHVLERLGISVEGGGETRIAVPPDLRAQLGSSGVSGVKYILIDYFDPKTHKPPALGFPPPEHYIPGEASTLKNLEDSVVKAVDQFPVLASEMLRVLNQVNAILGDIRDQKVPEKAIATLAHVDDTLLLLQNKLRGLDTAGLSADARKALQNLDKTASEAQKALAGVERASNAVGDVASGARNLGPDLSSALRDVSEAARSLQEILQELETDPDMLLKGRSVTE